MGASLSDAPSFSEFRLIGSSARRAARLSCPACGAPIPSEDSTPTAAVCRQGRALVNPRELAPSAPPPPVDLPSPRQVDFPEGFAVNRTPVGLALSCRWFSLATIFLLFFGAFWNGFLVAWRSNLANKPDIGWLPWIFPLLQVAVGVFYLALAGLFNVTTLTVGNRRLEVRHGPLPWRARRPSTRMTLFRSP
ncbi:MAG: hypothetical protein CFK52_08970 [Chloracidobacterium sp. CP2_5A]|nr:MAG: hypothetical protein CFK52_08970 [Chloracidobacterium sp. CP2_5A]